jgi:hypothetical protein
VQKLSTDRLFSDFIGGTFGPLGALLVGDVRRALLEGSGTESIAGQLLRQLIFLAVMFTDRSEKSSKIGPRSVFHLGIGPWIVKCLKTLLSTLYQQDCPYKHSLLVVLILICSKLAHFLQFFSKTGPGAREHSCLFLEKNRINGAQHPGADHG